MSAVSEATEEIGFRTSGQSGEPVTWYRTAQQLEQEAALLARTLVGTVDEVVSFAHERHLYGRLLGEALPRHLGVPVRHRWQDPLTPPDLDPDRRTLLVCLPSTWLLLRPLVPRLRRMSVVAVHGTGPVVPATHEVIAALDGSDFTASEVFGSTETGGVAYRWLTGARREPAPWTTFDDVTVVGERDREQRLTVRSPRLARRADMSGRPEELTTDDVVRPRSDGLEIVGRASRLAKVNGVRFQLEQVEAVLTTGFPHAEFVCVSTADDVRAEHYELYYACDEPIPVADLHARITRSAPGVPVPRQVRRVTAFRRSAVGKIRRPVPATACGVV
ncbi:acyl-CoA synthetase [Myceligenerans xiligouense]|uniref:Acyl-CoA synthetase (AMP-forming)/AMP-acid ligase II n=1 Tax=Myceligenerans xiligouense TaxID=253184 RepID=A0A3N4YIZ1_9MICO|nr:acyl-CoA synthetase [Myceligenerans xiligouense]RPF20743.1 hypothetical protein EDD34_1347 [Myceligenerans xiligouense]